MEDWIIDEKGTLLAKIQVVIALNKKHVEARLLENNFGKELNDLLLEYDDVVKKQMFSFIEELDIKLEQYVFRLKSSNKRVYDLQLTNDTDLTFRFEKNW